MVTPSLMMVMTCATLVVPTTCEPKVTDASRRRRAVVPFPMPVRGIEYLFAEPSVTVIWPVSVPATVGVKFTRIRQEDPGAIGVIDGELAVQSSNSVKSPVTATLAIPREETPVLVSVTTCAVLVEVVGGVMAGT